MPTYLFKCDECENRFESIRPMAERDRPAECPECGSRNTHRRIAMPAAVIDWRDSDSLANVKRFREPATSGLQQRRSV